LLLFVVILPATVVTVLPILLPVLFHLFFLLRYDLSNAIAAHCNHRWLIAISFLRLLWLLPRSC